MGSQQSRSATKGPKVGSPHRIMEDKYGEAAVKYIEKWMIWTGGEWPVGGSFDINKIKEVIKTVQSKRLKRREEEGHNLALRLWKCECELRNANKKREEAESLLEQEVALKVKKEKETKGKASKTGLYPNLHLDKVDTESEEEAVILGQTNGQVMQGQLREQGAAGGLTDEQVKGPLTSHHSPPSVPAPPVQSPEGGEGRQASQVVIGDLMKALEKLSMDAPVAHRTRTAKQDEVAYQQMPMKVVATGTGDADRAFIYRPWTPSELHSMISQFPKPDVNPVGFMANLRTVCHCYDPTPRDMQQVMISIFQDRFDIVKNNMAIPEIDRWTNVETREACVTRIEGAIKEYARRNACLSNITTCKQEESESVEQYVRRFKMLWETNSGMDANQGMAFQVNCFVNGLLPQLAKHLKVVMLNWETAPFADIQTAAINVERQQREKKKPNTVRGEVGLFYANAGMHREGRPDRGRFYRRGRGQRRGPNEGNRGSKGRDGCFICGSIDHWIKDCPHENPRRRPEPSAPEAPFTAEDPFKTQ